MDKVLTDFANIAAGIVESLIKSVPGTDSQLYWLMLGGLVLLLALLLTWLLLRMRRARLAKAQDAVPAPEMTFSDVTAEAAEAGEGIAPPPAAEAPETPAAPQVAAEVAGDIAGDGDVAAAAAPATRQDTAPSPPTGEGSGFRFFKRKGKEAAASSDGEPEDDVFLLGLEQEMLATRQLYLDGLISKEVYVTETRALYDKAQSRMT